MRTALILLFLLALASLPGALLPQWSLNTAKTAQYIVDHPTLGPVAGPVRVLRGVRLALVRGHLPAAVPVADRLPAAAHHGVRRPAADAAGGHPAQPRAAAASPHRRGAGIARPGRRPDRPPVSRAGGSPGATEAGRRAAAPARDDLGREGLRPRGRQPGLPPVPAGAAGGDRGRQAGRLRGVGDRQRRLPVLLHLARVLRQLPARAAGRRHRRCRRSAWTSRTSPRPTPTPARPAGSSRRSRRKAARPPAPTNGSAPNCRSTTRSGWTASGCTCSATASPRTSGSPSRTARCATTRRPFAPEPNDPNFTSQGAVKVLDPPGVTGDAVRKQQLAIVGIFAPTAFLHGAIMTSSFPAPEQPGRRGRRLPRRPRHGGRPGAVGVRHRHLTGRQGVADQAGAGEPDAGRVDHPRRRHQDHLHRLTTSGCRCRPRSTRRRSGRWSSR